MEYFNKKIAGHPATPGAAQLSISRSSNGIAAAEAATQTAIIIPFGLCFGVCGRFGWRCVGCFPLVTNQNKNEVHFGFDYCNNDARRERT